MTRSRPAVLVGLSLSATLVTGCAGSSGYVSGSGLGAVATPRRAGDVQVFRVTGTSSRHFSPGELHATPGKIRVDFSVERGSVPHDLVVADIADADTGLLSGGDKGSTTFTVTRPGTYGFVCTIHPTMTGTLRVG